MFTSDSTTTDLILETEAASPRRRRPLRRLAQLVALPLAALGLFAGVGATTANAATSGHIGQLGVTVGCLSQTHQMSMSPWAIEGSAFTSQYVAFQLAYTSSGRTHYTGWYGPKLVDGTTVHESYFTGTFTTSAPQRLGTVTASNVHGIGKVWVRAGFWNGRAYEYTTFVPASTYFRYINGRSFGGSAAPCVMS